MKKLCVDCRHYQAGIVGQCVHPSNMRDDLERGGKRAFAAPFWLRSDDKACGASGNWHVSREEQPEAASGCCEVTR